MNSEDMNKPISKKKKSMAIKFGELVEIIKAQGTFRLYKPLILELKPRNLKKLK